MVFCAIIGSMEPVLTRCGYRCDLCLAYRPNIEAHPESRSRLSDGWQQYFGFRLQPEEIICDGCMADSPCLIDQNCPVRACVIEKGLTNCAACEAYICDKLTDRLVTFDEVLQRVKNHIPPQDRLNFILPYENKARLDALRGSPASTMTPEVLLENIGAGYTRFNRVLKPLSAAELQQPCITGTWSVKDILAHITAHEVLMLNWMKLRLHGVVPAGPQPYDMPAMPLAGLNERIFEENRSRALDEVLRDFDQTHVAVLEFVSSAPRELLFGPNGPCLQGGEPLWVAVAANTYEHMDEHGREIREAFSC